MNSRADGVSVIIPAYNEAENLRGAVKSAVRAVSAVVARYEILIIDDASFDATKTVGKKLASTNPHIVYVRRSVNGGLGEAFRTGISHVTMPYVSWFPGDNDTSGLSLKDLVRVRHSADLVMSYSINTWTRSFVRRFISWGFTSFLNILFGFHIRYYNGCFITKTDLVRSVVLKSTGHAIFAELKIKLITNGASYKEIPFRHIGRKTGVTTAFRWKNIIATLRTIRLLFWDVHMGR